MEVRTIIRLGGVCMMISGPVLGYSYIAHPTHMTPEVIGSSFWILIHALFALSLVLGLLGTLALYAPGVTHSGVTGLVGFTTLFIGMMLIFGLDYYETLIAPYLAVHYPQVIADHGPGDAMGPIAIFFPLAGMMTVVGYALLGAAWLGNSIVSRQLGVSLIVTALAFGFGLSPLGGLMAARVTAAAFGLCLMGIGFVAWRNAGRFQPA